MNCLLSVGLQQFGEAELRFGEILVRCRREPPRRRGDIARHPAPGLVHGAEQPLAAGIALDGGLAVQPRGPVVVPLDAPAGRIEIAEDDLGRCEALSGGLPVPVRRLAVVLRNALSGPVQPAQIRLRLGIALLGGGAVPAGGRREIAGDAEPFLVTRAEAVLCQGKALVRGTADPAGRHHFVLLRPAPFTVEEGKIDLRLYVAGLGKRREQAERHPVIAPLVGRDAAFERRLLVLFDYRAARRFPRVRHLPRARR